jgi:hypothetical protein
MKTSVENKDKQGHQFHKAHMLLLFNNMHASPVIYFTVLLFFSFMDTTSFPGIISSTMSWQADCLLDPYCCILQLCCIAPEHHLPIA